MAVTRGSWSFGGLPTIDLGLTEGLLSAYKNLSGNQNVNLSAPSLFNNPNVYTANANSNPQNQVFYQAGTQTKINPAPATNTGGSGTGQVLGTATGANLNDNSFIGPQLNDISSTMNNQISSGWDSYTTQLNDILNNSLPEQRGAQETMALNSYNTGVNQLGQQRTSSEGQVSKQQASSLKDLSSNVQNLFNAGNTYLGSRGAADSSAANQYAYAITKMGTKARGDIQSQANQRLQQISDIYNSEVNRLDSEKNMQLANIAQWFSEQQAMLKQQLGQAGLSRSQDLQAASQNLYNQALQMMNNYQNEQASRRSALESWALNNSKSINEVIQNFQSLAQLPQFQGIQTGMPTVSSEGQPNLFGYGSFGGNTDEKKSIFG